MSHALFKGLLFLCAGAIVHMTGETELSKMGDLARRQPVLAAAFIVGVAGIAGVPPLSGYASLGLIHDATRSSDPVAYVVEIAAQVVTVAALARAAHVASFRPRRKDYERFDRMHPGMIAALWTLGLASLLLGVFPGWVIATIAAPAASSLLHVGVYAHGVLAGAAHIPTLHVSLGYFGAEHLLTAAATVALGLGLAHVYQRIEEPAPITVLRRLHTGSVNDYAAFTVIGALGALGALLL
jgi:multicomponent Na+:H+ antiporter subunit D